MPTRPRDDSEVRELVRQGWELLKRRHYSAAARDINSHWRRLALALQKGHIDLDELDEFQELLQMSLFGDPPFYGKRRRDVRRSDPRLNRLLDSLRALAVSEPSDASYSWTRGSVLFAVGRHVEAAGEFLTAAKQLDDERQKGTDLEDIELWIEGSLYHAAKNLVLGSELLSVTILLPRLSSDDQTEIREMISRRMDRATSSGEPGRKGEDKNSGPAPNAE